MNVRLTADANGFNTVIDGARNSLSSFAIEERSLQAQQAALNREITANADKIEMLGRRCGSLSQTIANQNQKIQQAVSRYGENSVQVTRLRTGLERLENIYDAYNAKLVQAQQRSARLAQQLSSVQEREQQLRETVRNTNNSLEQQQKEFAQTAIQSDNMANQLKSTFLMLKGLAMGYAGKTLFNALIGSNAEYEQSMTSFEVLLQSADKADKLMSEITEYAVKTPFGAAQLQQSAKMLLGYGVQAENLMDIMSRLGDLSQGDAEKLNRVSLAYGQMLAKGRVTGEELRQMVEAQVPLLQGLVDYLGKSSAEVQQMITTKKVGIDDLNGAIKQMTSEGGQFFGMLEKKAATMTGMWETLKDTLAVFGREVGDEAFNALKNELSELIAAIKQMQNSGHLSEIAEEYGRSIAGFVKIVTGAIEIIYKMRSAIIGASAAWVTWNTLNTVIPTVKSTISAVKLLSTVIQLGATKQQLQNLIDGKTVLLKNSVTGAITIETAAKAREITATDGATVSQLKFNAALLANPYTWVAVVLGALVTGLMAYNQHLDSVKQAEQQARSEAVQTANEYQEQRKSIDELTNKYKELASQTNLDESAKQELKSIQEQLNSLFDGEGEKLDLVNGKYEEQIEKIQNLSREKAKEKDRELYVDYVNAKSSFTQNRNLDYGANTVGDSNDQLKLYEDELNRLERLRMEKGKLEKTEETYYKSLTKGYTEFKKQITEEIKIMNSRLDIAVAAGNMTEEQAEREKTAIAGSIENWNELTDAQNENAVSVTNAGDAAVSAVQNQSEALDDINNRLSMVQTAMEELDENKKININTLCELIEVYPELISCLDDEKALQAALTDIEKEETDNYLSLMQEKYANTVLFGDNVAEEHQRLINNLAQAYETDGSNFQSMADIKLAIDNLLINTLGENWSQFYVSQSEALKGFINNMNTVMGPLTKEQAENLAKAEALLDIYEMSGTYEPKTINLPKGSKKSASGKKSGITEKKSVTDAARTEQEYIKSRFTEEDRWRQMGWISEQQYYENITALRDKYYEKWSDDWWTWTLKINSYNESCHNSYAKILEKNFDEYLSASSDYISKCENDGWGTDSEIDAYKRRAEKIKEFQSEFLKNQQLTADERNDLWIKANDELYQNSQSLKQALKADLSVKNQNSLDYIETRTYFNDWQNVGNTPDLAFKRIKERNRAALNEGYISYEEYAENLYEVGQKLYDGRLTNSYDWLEHEKKYNGLSARDYISGLERMRAYTQEYYESGIIDYRKYYEEMQNINDDIFDANVDLIDDMLNDGNNAYEELKQTFSEIENQLSDTWSHDDRINDINRTFAELDEFKGAVTVAGQDKYEQLSKELLSLQREEELYNLQQDNNKILADIEETFKELEKLKTDKITELAVNTDKIQAAINSLVEIGKNLGREQSEKAQRITAQYTTNNSIVQNNTVNDTVAANALMGSIIGILK